MASAVKTLWALSDYVGHKFEPSGWGTIDQTLISRFAAVTGDDNWYHVDVERAAAELPDGKTIAHGLLLLALLPGLSRQIINVTEHGRALNYGYDKVRFLEPVNVGDRVRLTMSVDSTMPAKSGLMIERTFTLQGEGKPRPVMIAKALSLALP